MANTVSLVKDVYPYVLNQVSEVVGMNLRERKLLIGKNKREKKFDGVSDDGKIIISIFTSSGNSKSGNSPSGKINALYATCYMMNLTNAERKILAFTNNEFYKIIKIKTQGFLDGFELMFISLPKELEEITKSVSRAASEEMA